MKVSFMRGIDYWVGIPLCFLLSMVNRLVRTLYNRKPDRPKRILFIELSEMGSAILSYSAMTNVQSEFPGSELYFLIFKRNRESVDLLGIMPEGNVIVIDDSSLGGFAVSVLAALRKLRSLKIDTAIDLELFSRFTALLSFLSGAMRRVGFDNGLAEGLYRGSFLTHKVLFNPYLHISENFLALALSLSAPAGQSPLLKRCVRDTTTALPRLVPTEAEVSTMRRKLNGPNGPGTRYVVMNPDPGLLPLRGWPIERFAETASSLAKLFPSVVFVVIGLPSAKWMAARIGAGLPTVNVVDFTGRTDSLREVLTLLSFSELLITNDSGPAHIAALVNVKSIVLFGPETPRLYGPLHERVHTVTAGLACSPCYAAYNHRRTACRDNVCLQAISVESVVRKAAELLSEK